MHNDVTGCVILISILQKFGYSLTLRSPNRAANEIRRSYKNDEFHWSFDFVAVT